MDSINVSSVFLFLSPFPVFFTFTFVSSFFNVLQAAMANTPSLPSPLPPPLYFPLSPSGSGYYCCITNYSQVEQLQITILFCSILRFRNWKGFARQLSLRASPLVEVAAGWERSHLKARLGWPSQVAHVRLAADADWLSAAPCGISSGSVCIIDLLYSH